MLGINRLAVDPCKFEKYIDRHGLVLTNRTLHNPGLVNIRLYSASARYLRYSVIFSIFSAKSQPLLGPGS